MRSRDRFLAAAAVAATAFSLARWTLCPRHLAALPEMLLRGLALTPFQYRVLIPRVVGAGASLGIPAPLLFVAADALALFAALLSFRGLLADAGVPSRRAEILPFSLFLFLPIHAFAGSLNYWYPWDLPSLAFATVGLRYLAARRWRALYLLFFVATWNRETILFLVAAILATRRGIRPAAVCVSIWIAVKGVLFLRYRENPGLGLMEWKGPENLSLLSDPGFLVRSLGAWGALAGLAFVARSRVRDPFWRDVPLAAIAFLAALGIGSNLNEYRVFTDLLPYLLPPVLVARWRDASGESDGRGGGI